MSQLRNPVEPFGEVNIHLIGERTRIVATISMRPHKDGTQTGIALDGSGSMAGLYGQEANRVVSPLFKKPAGTNQITPVAQKLCSYLARTIDADSGTTVIYWSTGPAGSQIEVVGDFTADRADKHTFAAPKNLGTGTQLLPAVKYFVERFSSAGYGFFVFITDGSLHDLEEVKTYTRHLAAEVSVGRRKPVKLLLLGIGNEVDIRQLEELDDLDTPYDVWDYKLAAELRELEQIFAEVVDRNARVAERGRILDAAGKVVKDYSDVGLPARLEFELPVSATYFTLEVNGQTIHQPLSETASAPTPAKVTSVVPQATPTAVAKAAPTPIDDEPKDIDANGSSDDEWKKIDLQFDTDKGGDLDLKFEK
jgi:hypothetical protein